MSVSGDDSDPSSSRDDDVFKIRTSLSRSSLVNVRKRSPKKQKLRAKPEGNTKNIRNIMQAIHASGSAIEKVSISKESNHKIQFKKGNRDVVQTGLSNFLKDCNLILAVAVEILDRCTTLQTICMEKDAKVSKTKDDFHNMAMKHEIQIAELTSEQR